MLMLFLGAGLIVARVAILIDKTFSPATAARIVSPVKTDYGDSNDWDHDGLTNAEEALLGTDPYNPDTDGDGYLDGEEVASGHNPLVPDNPLMPGSDSLDKQKQFLGLNSTQRLAQAITGGILSGDLKKGGDPRVMAKSIDSVATATVHATLAALEAVEVSEDEINISPDNSKTAQEKYLGVIFQSISGDIMDLVFNQSKEIVLLFSASLAAPNGELFDTQQKEDIKTKFLKHAVTFQKAYDKLKETPVPSQWTNIHKKILTLLKKLELYHRSIALSNDDSLKQTIVLGNLQNVYFQSQPILSAINQLITANQLKTPYNDFFSINSLLTK